MSGKGGGKRRRDPSEYNPRERQKIAQYYKKKKASTNEAPVGPDRRGGAGPSREREPEEYTDNEWSDLDPDDVPLDNPDGGDMGEDEIPMQQGRAGGGSGGGGGGYLGDQEVGDRPFGTKARIRSKTYTKSYVVYIRNGQDQLNWAQNPGTNIESPEFQWNEGWQILGGYGDFMAAMTPGDWFQLNMNASRIRFKSCSVLLEGMIPFQENLDAQGNPTTVATASNRPNIWYYIDDGKTLPKLAGAVDLAHNAHFQLPYGNFQSCTLLAPTFGFNNVNINNMPYRVTGNPAAGEPQKIYSLMSTGRVKTLNPGQKLRHSWKNPSKQWSCMRLNTDTQNFYTANPSATPGAWQHTKADTLTVDCRAGMGSRAYGNVVLANAPGPTSQNGLYHYADTGIHLQESGPPYILLKVEPYFDTQNNVANIYMKANIHYSIEVEWLETEQHNSVVWCNSFPATQVANNLVGFEIFNAEVTKEAGECNEQNTVFGPGNQTQMYT